jgi:hypothetical protein
MRGASVWRPLIDKTAIRSADARQGSRAGECALVVLPLVLLVQNVLSAPPLAASSPMF